MALIHQMTLQLTPKEYLIVEAIMREHEVRRAEAVRIAVRAYKLPKEAPVAVPIPNP
jgi:hypothetical protein